MFKNFELESSNDILFPVLQYVAEFGRVAAVCFCNVPYKLVDSTRHISLCIGIVPHCGL